MTNAKDSDLAQALVRLQNARITGADPQIPYAVNIPNAHYAPWFGDELFMTIHAEISQFTLLDIYRCYEIWDLCRQTAHVPGEAIEIGVWRGGSAALIGAAFIAAGQFKTVHACDTFHGVVKTGAMDRTFRGGEHGDTSPEIVAEALRKAGAPNVEIHAGIFPDDFLGLFEKSVFSYAHIDVDAHDSARDSFEFLWPRLSTGGIVVFDDYGFIGCEGVTRFVDSLRGRSSSRLVLHNLNGHAVVIKTGAAD